MLGRNPSHANHNSLSANRATRLAGFAFFVGRGLFLLFDTIDGVVFVTRAEQLTGQLEFGIAISVGHEAGMPNLPESTWDHM